MKKVAARGVPILVAWVALGSACTKPNPNYCPENPNKDCTIDAAGGAEDDGGGRWRRRQ